MNFNTTDILNNTILGVSQEELIKQVEERVQEVVEQSEYKK